MAPCSTRAAAMFQYVVTMRYGALVLPRYTVRISSALAGANCSRNQARAFRMTGSRRRSYSLSSRSALSYLVFTGGSVMAVARKLRGLFPGGDPGAPRLLRRAHAQLLLMADQRHAEQQRLQGQLLEPAVLREQRRREAQLREALGVAVDQRADTELLGEAAQLARRGGTLGSSVQGSSSLGSTAGRSYSRSRSRVPATVCGGSPFPFPASPFPVSRHTRGPASTSIIASSYRSRSATYGIGARAAATCATTSRATACAVSWLPSTTLRSSTSNPSPLRTASGGRPVTRASEREYLKNWTMRS